jgi:hypothetical protein
MTTAIRHRTTGGHARTAPSSAPVPTADSRLTSGPVVLGAALTGAVGYAIALWFARMAVYAERVEEQQYCAPPVPTAASAA